MLTKIIDAVVVITCGFNALYFLLAQFGFTHPTVKDLYFPAVMACVAAGARITDRYGR